MLDRKSMPVPESGPGEEAGAVNEGEGNPLDGLPEGVLDLLVDIAAEEPESEGVLREEVPNRIREQVDNAGKLTDAVVESRIRELRDKPILDAPTLESAIAYIRSSGPKDLKWIEVEKIVGRTFDSPGGWAYEYPGRRGRINASQKNCIVEMNKTSKEYFI